MNRSIAIVLILASLTVGGVVGYIVGFAKRPANELSPIDPTATLQEQFQEQLLDVSPEAALLAGVGTLNPVETGFDDWTYPDARSFETSKMVEDTVREDEQILAHTEIGACNVLSSPDNFETVVAHYVRQMERLLPSIARRTTTNALDESPVK